MVLYFIVNVVLQIIDPYVEVEVLGIPADSCKRRTKTIMDNGTGMMKTIRFRYNIKAKFIVAQIPR